MYVWIYIHWQIYIYIYTCIHIYICAHALWDSDATTVLRYGLSIIFFCFLGLKALIFDWSHKIGNPDDLGFATLKIDHGFLHGLLAGTCSMNIGLARPSILNTSNLRYLDSSKYPEEGKQIPHNSGTSLSIFMGTPKESVTFCILRVLKDIERPLVLVSSGGIVTVVKVVKLRRGCCGNGSEGFRVPFSSLISLV